MSAARRSWRRSWAEQITAGSLPDAPVLMTPLARRVLDRYRAGDPDGLALPDIPYPERVGTLRPEETADEVVSLRRT